MRRDDYGCCGSYYVLGSHAYYSEALTMDFTTMKRNRGFPKADTKNPWMGLNGVICENPAYWCRLHEVWLSEADVEKKHCLSRLTYDMIGTCRCNCIEPKPLRNPFGG